MNNLQINKLLSDGVFPQCGCEAKLQQTHISWILLCGDVVFKIKKPLKYSFLDFSTLEKRKFYCEREVVLNRRLTEDVYIDVQPVKELNGRFFIGDAEGAIVDYAVFMRRLDAAKQMDVMLQRQQVTMQHMQQLAEKISAFHKSATPVFNKDYLDIRSKFNDLSAESNFLAEQLTPAVATLISDAIRTSDAFIAAHAETFKSRLAAGFFRDCHGDLHSRNIFLLAVPQPFDCIEFNDDIRQIDVLNDVAFLCMDLDAFGRQDLAEGFMQFYTAAFQAMRNEEERRLFVYYKAYRANIRAKINSLRARTETDVAKRQSTLQEAMKYLTLMQQYSKTLTQ